MFVQDKLIFSTPLKEERLMTVLEPVHFQSVLHFHHWCSSLACEVKQLLVDFPKERDRLGECQKIVCSPVCVGFSFILALSLA